RVAEGNVVPEIGVLQLFVKLGDGVGQGVGQDRARLSGGLVLAPDGLEFQACVVLDDLLNAGDVLVVEVWCHAVGVDAHVLDEGLIVERE
nr:hypothetical protein [Tanacetum cinerariifolium]